MTSHSCKRLFPIMIILALSACKSEDDASTQNPVWTGPRETLEVVRPDNPLGVLGGWFVREFDMEKVARIRQSTTFKSQDLTYSLSAKRQVIPDRSGTINANAYHDIGLDYAWSTGLTGKGSLISIMDSRILAKHGEFAGKPILISPGSAAAADSHGTSVASIAAGFNGVAPGAEIHHGAIEYSSGQSLDIFTGHMNDAAVRGALVSNNSWTFNVDLASSTDGSFLDYGAGRDYLASLRHFTRTGTVVFAAQNNYAATSSHLMAALPALYPELEDGWLAVINAIPVRRGDRIESATRVSSACLEAAPWCVAANGQVNVAYNSGVSHYGLGSGASFSAPQASGSLALLAEAFPTLTPKELRARLLVTADNGFYEHDGVVEFAPGLSHGYNREWGHGFIDMRAALLPIGTVSTATEGGGSVELSDITISSGQAVGDAILNGLGQYRMVTTDQMEGDFVMPASSIVALPGSGDGPGLAERISGQNIKAYRMATQSAVTGDMRSAIALPGLLSLEESSTLEGSAAFELARNGDYSLAARRSGDDDAGISVSRFFTGPISALEIGVEAIRKTGSIMGVSGFGTSEGSTHLGVTAVAAFNLGREAVMRLDGKIGRASGGRPGRQIEIRDLRYDSLGMAIAFANNLDEQDVLTLFARQPVAVSAGTANIFLAMPAAEGEIKFDSAQVDMSPASRQLDIGMEYMRPLGQDTELAFALRHTSSKGNIEGRKDTEVGITLNRSF